MNPIMFTAALDKPALLELDPERYFPWGAFAWQRLPRSRLVGLEVRVLDSGPCKIPGPNNDPWWYRQMDQEALVLRDGRLYCESTGLPIDGQVYLDLTQSRTVDWLSRAVEARTDLEPSTVARPWTGHREGWILGRPGEGQYTSFGPEYLEPPRPHGRWFYRVPELGRREVEVARGGPRLALAIVAAFPWNKR